MSRIGHHENSGHPKKPQYQQIKGKKIKANLKQRFFSRRTDVGRTGHHDDCGHPSFGLL